MFDPDYVYTADDFDSGVFHFSANDECVSLHLPNMRQPMRMTLEAAKELKRNLTLSLIVGEIAHGD